MILMPFTHRSLWFITGYIILYFLSPILNEAVEHLSKQRYLLVLVLLTILNIYFGFWRNIYNTNGYNYAQMVYLYMVAGYFRKHAGIDYFQRHRWKFFLCYLIGAGTWTILTIVSLYVELPHWKSMSYNNPFTIISSVGFFCFMMSFSFHSETVNWIAKSCFAMYLLQNKTMFQVLDSTLHKYILVEETFMKCAETWLIILVLSIAFMSLAVMVDRIRMAITNPVLRLYDKFYEKYSLQKYE